MKYDHDFWSAIDTLVSSGKIVIDRPKGSTHPRFPHIRYDVDYGYITAILKIPHLWMAMA